jgi:hypothetical protein
MRSDIAIGLVTILMTILGGVVSAHAPQKLWQKWLYAITFIAFGVIAMFFVWRLSDESVASSRDALRNLLGDSEHPPWIGVISWPGLTRFVTTNNSDYPTYISGMELREDTDGIAGGETRSYGQLELPAHTARTDERAWVAIGEGTHHHFVATITTRSGLFREEMMLDRAGNNQWARAVRVMQGMRTLEEDIDSAWPRDPSGRIEWKR